MVFFLARWNLSDCESPVIVTWFLPSCPGTLLIVTVPNSSCGKVTFLHLPVNLFTGGLSACGVRG